MSSFPRDEEAIFLAALEQETPEEEAAYVKLACAGDSELRNRVLELLKSHHLSAGPFDVPPPELQATHIAPEISTVGDQIGFYKLLEQIGEGGFGIVYMAEQYTPVRRKVALKIIKPGMDTKQVLARFEAERHALGMMDHPNIARALDAGATDSGRPYFVMELVRGVSITEYCDQHNLDVTKRIDLFVQVCHAVQHAHQKGIIHRDIKPSNVLVTMHDGRPAPKVIDFGVAKAINQQLTQETLFTRFAEMIGTPLYMSPEQAEMTSLDIDTRSDIYSLGVLLYELLTGTTPFDKNRLKKAAHDEVCRIIREEEPPKPSTRISTLGVPCAAMAAHRHSTPQLLGRLVRGDLDWIVMKSLEKDRTRRYETANGLAMDLQRHLADEPVVAGPPSAAYRFRKFARRNRVALAMIGVITVALLLGIVGTTWQSIRATQERDRAVAAEGLAQSHLVAETLARAGEAEQRHEAETQREKAEANFQNARKAVDEYFTLVSEDKLLDVPGLQPLRKDLLEAALRFYEKTAVERANDPAVLADLAATKLRLAQIYLMLNRADDSIPANQEALDLVDRLLREYPSAGEDQRRLAGFWKGMRMTTNNIAVRDPLAAFRMLLRFEKTWMQLVERHPSEPAFQSDLAGIQGLIGGAWEEMGRPEETVSSLRKACATLKKLIHEHPGVAQYRADMGIGLQGLVRALVKTGENVEALTLIREAMGLWESLVAEFPTHPTYRSEQTNCLRRLADLVADAQPQEAERHRRRAMELAEALVREFPSLEVFRHSWSAANESVATQAEASGNLAAVEEALRSRLRIQEMLAAYKYDDHLIRVDLAGTLHRLARHLARDPERLLDVQELDRRSLAFLTEAAAAVERKLIADRPSDAQSQEKLFYFYQALGCAFAAAGRADEAKKTFRQGADQMAMLASEFPDSAACREAVGHMLRHLGYAMSNSSDAHEKEQAFRDSVQIFDKLATDDPNAAKYRVWLADSQRALGELYAANKRFDEADGAYVKSIELGEKLAADYPKNVEYQLQLALRSHDLANVLKTVGRSAEAEQRYRDALVFEEKLVADASAKPDYRFHLAHTDLGLAYLLAGTNRVDEAEQHFRKAVAIFEKLAADFPAQHNYRMEVGHVLWHLGNHAATAGRHEESEKHHRRALAVFEKLAADVPGNAFYRMEQGYSHWNLGALLVQLGRLQDAADSYRSALMVYSKLAADFPGDTEYRSRRTRSYTLLIDVLLPLAQHAEAAKLAIELSDKSPDKSNSLRAGVYLEQCAAVAHKDESLSPPDRTPVADAYAKQAAELLSEARQRVAGDGQLENHLAWGLVTNPNPDLRAPARAVELSQKAVELAPLSGYIWNTLGVAHYRAGDWSAGITALEKSMELRHGGDSTDWFILSMCLWQQGEQDRARTWDRAARLWMAIYDPQDDELKRFRAEAAALMGISETEPLDKVDDLALGETLVTASPTASSYRLRGAAFANAEQWDRAAEDFAKAIELGDKGYFAWYARALVRLAADDQPGFQVVCAEMLKQFAQTEDAPSAHFVAWTCALGPEALTDFAPAVALAEKAANFDAKSAHYANSLGAILYRSGRFDEARQKLDDADRLASAADPRLSPPAYTWFFLAMTHHRIGNADQAKKWLGKAREVTDKAQKDHDSGTATLPWNRRITLKFLRQEAESLLGNEQSPTP